MAWKKLGRRSAAPVQSTELDLPSGETKHGATVSWLLRAPDKGPDKGERQRPASGSSSAFIVRWRPEGLPHDLGHGRLTELAGRTPYGWRTEPRSSRLFQPVAIRTGSGRSASSGTAFLVMNGVEEARAAQRRPGAEHRARPALRLWNHLARGHQYHGPRAVINARRSRIHRESTANPPRIRHESAANPPRWGVNPGRRGYGPRGDGSQRCRRSSRRSARPRRSPACRGTSPMRRAAS